MTRRPRLSSRSRLTGALAPFIVLASGPVHAADAASPDQGPATAVSEIVVTSDKAGLLEKRPSNTVLGLTKPLIETPRSASLVSDVTIERYGIQTINDFVAVSPSTYTASFYGVPGSLNIRGTLADNYFQGFKLIENRGTYTTPIGDASQVEVVRGPPSPIYGPGKVGGFLNFVPKSAQTESLTGPAGEIEITGGSYGKKNADGQFGTPFTIGGVAGGLYAYGEVEDSDSFYYGIHPKHQLGEVSIDFKFPDNWTWSTDALVYHSTGDVQTAGWNRLTQNLIDNQQYITGRNTTLMNTPGVPYLTPNQATPGAFAPYPNNFTAVGGGLYAAYYGFPPSLPAQFTLNSPGAGTLTTLSPRTVDVGPLDFSDTMTETIVSGLSHQFADDSTLKLQLFWNGLENKRFVSYGFPAWLRANAYEARVTYDFTLGARDGPISADTIVGGSYRYYQGRDMQSFNSGLIALDRRDLSVGATPTDTICDPFLVGITGDQQPSNCQGWEEDIHSVERDGGLFFPTDVAVLRRLDVVLGGRYDWYDVTSIDTGILSFDTPGTQSASKGHFTYTAAGTYKLGWGLMPYVTWSENAALEAQQAGDIRPADIASGGWLSKSDLIEGGVKFQLVGNTLVGSIDGYEQHRTSLSGLNAVSQRTRSDGAEIEVRWLATKNVSFTLSGDDQRTEVLGPDASTVYIPAQAVCGATLACELSSWGGAYLVFNFDSLPGRAGDYKLSTIPDSVVSFHANYVSDDHSWGRAGVTAGVTYVTKTSGTIENAITYPAYSLVDLSAFYQRGPWELAANIENLFNTLYFTPNSDPTYVNVSAIPGVGRQWRLTLKRKF